LLVVRSLLLRDRRSLLLEDKICAFVVEVCIAFVECIDHECEKSLNYREECLLRGEVQLLALKRRVNCL